MTKPSPIVLVLLLAVVGAGGILAVLFLQGPDVPETTVDEAAGAPDQPGVSPAETGPPGNGEDADGAPAPSRVEAPVSEAEADAIASGAAEKTMQLAGRVLFDDAGRAPAAGATIRAWPDFPPLSPIIQSMGEIANLERSGPPAAEQSFTRRALRVDRADEGERPARPRIPRPLREVVADEQGNFRFDDLPRRTVHLDALLPAWRTTRGTRVEPDDPPESLDLLLSPAGRVRGAVTFPDGTPAADARVSISSPFDPFGVLSGDMGLRAPAVVLTDAEGSYSFGSVPGPHEWRLQAECSPHGPSPGSQVVVQPGSTAVVDLVLDVETRLEVTVVDADDNPVPEAHVTVFPRQFDFAELTSRPEGPEGMKQRCDENGRVTIAGVTPGDYQATATRRGYQPTEPLPVTVLADEVARVELTLLGGVEVSGQVTDLEGTPLPKARVRVRARVGLADLWNLITSGAGTTVRTDDEGRFRVGGLPPGDLFVIAEADGYSMGKVEVEAPDDAVQLALEPQATIEGIVVSRVHGTPVERFDLELEAEKETSMFPISFEIDLEQRTDFIARQLAFTSEKGRFRVTNVPAGTWRVKVEADGHARHSSDWVTVAPGEVRRGVLCYLVAEAVIAGRVIDDAAAPVKGAKVSLEQGPGGGIGRMLAVMFQMDAVTTGEDGTFRIGGLRGGRYSVTARAENHADATASGIEVREGEVHQDVVLELPSGGEIFGLVQDVRGRPLDGAQVMVAESMQMLFRTSRTDAEGWYRVQGVPAGRYQVTLMPDMFKLDPETMISQMTEQIRTQNVELEVGESLRVDFGADEGGSAVLEGVVRHVGEPWPGALVTVVCEGEFLPGAGQTGTHTAASKDDGSFRIERLPAGHAVVQVIPALDAAMGGGGGQTYDVELTSGKTTTLRIDLPAGRLHGRLEDEQGASLAGVQVYVAIEGGTAAAGGLKGFAQRRAAGTQSKQDGRFELNHLAAGTYTVVAGGSDFLGMTSAPLAITRKEGVDLPEGGDVDVGTISLATPATLEGEVRDAQGDPVTSATVFLRRSEDGEFLEAFSAAATDRTGAYLYRGLPEGVFDVIGRAPGYSTTVVPRVRLQAGTTQTVDLTLAGGTEVYLVPQGGMPAEVFEFDLHVVGPHGRIPAGLFGLHDLASGALNAGLRGEIPLGSFGAGDYHVEGRFNGRSFTQEFQLRGEAELKIPVELPR